MYFLDFVDNAGKRIEGRTDLDVFDGEEGEHIYDLIKLLGKHYSFDCELEIYVLRSARAQCRKASQDHQISCHHYYHSAMCMNPPRYAVQMTLYPGSC